MSVAERLARLVLEKMAEDGAPPWESGIYTVSLVESLMEHAPETITDDDWVLLMVLVAAMLARTFAIYN
jgi:hypothetical protein